jgi:hypothetical protein
MELTIDGEPDTTTATEQKVTAAVEAMESFVILAASADHYLQIAEPDGALVLEYRDGGPDRHYRSTRTDLTRQDAAPIFRMYLKGDPRWREAVPWVPLTSAELEGPPFWTLWRIFPLALLAIVGLYFVFFR